MLVAVGGLDRREDLAGDAELGEGPERGFLLEVEVPDRLEEADHALLDDVFLVRAGEEVGAGLGPGEVPVAAQEDLEAALVAFLDSLDEDLILELGDLLFPPASTSLPSPPISSLSHRHLLRPPNPSGVRLFVRFCRINGPSGWFLVVPCD